MLYGNLCYGRNYFSKKIVKITFSCKTLLYYIALDKSNVNKRNKLPNSIRAALVYILMHSHLASKPRIEKNYPNMIHLLEAQTLFLKP